MLERGHIHKALIIILGPSQTQDAVTRRIGVPHSIFLFTVDVYKEVFESRYGMQFQILDVRSWTILHSCFTSLSSKMKPILPGTCDWFIDRR